MHQSSRQYGPSAAADLDRQIERTVITPVSAIEYRCPETWRQQRRRLDDSMWYWIQEGSGRGWIDTPDHVHVLKRGDLFIIPEGVEHETWPDPGVCIRTITVHFLARVDVRLDLLAMLGMAGVFPATRHAPYADASCAFANEYALKAPGWRWAAASTVQSVLLYIIRHYAGRLRLPDPAFHADMLRLRPVMDVIQNRLGDPDLTVADLAEAIFVSEVYLRKLFRRAFGQSPVQFVTRQRIERARALLRTTDLSVKAVCDQCGFRDLHFFYRVFRHTTNITPLDCRRSGPGT